MPRKKLIIGCLTGLLSLNVVHAQALDNAKATSHFIFHFSEMDENTVSLMAEELESFYTEISEEFSFSDDRSFDINIYPNITSFHEALGFNEAPSWAVARATLDTIDIVSPANPGPAHSEESIKKIMKLNIVKAVLFNKFCENNVPYWLVYGIGAVRATYGNSSHLFKYIPSLKELETSDYKNFSKINGFQVSYSFVEFVQETFGQNTLIELLSNYESRKETLYQNWINSIPQPLQ